MIRWGRPLKIIIIITITYIVESTLYMYELESNFRSTPEGRNYYFTYFIDEKV